MLRLLQRLVQSVRRPVLGLALIMLWLAPASVPAADNSSTEYRVKTAFLYNFSRFSSWPAPIEDNFKLCIIGKNPFGSLIDSLIGRTVHNNVLVVEHYDIEVAEFYDSLVFIKQCNLAYIDKSFEARLDDILYQLRDLPILTVSEISGFTQHGGIIGFKLIDNKVRFDINTEAAGYAGITISSKLLSLANIVKSKQ
jgi:hypothetical protein